MPGVVFLEIDGLAHDVLQRAMRDGNAPALARWVHERGYRLERWETDWSSQTGACQAGLLHGNDFDMPAFRWWEKDNGRAIVTNHPKDAAEIERRQSDGRGLLYADGASRANILSGDAPHSMLTMSTVLDRDRPGRLGQDYFAYFASPYGVARTALRVIGEIFIERFSAIQQVRRDVRPRIKRNFEYALVRSFATVIQLDLQVAAVTVRRARRPARDLHDVPGLRRGRAPLRDRAPGHAGGAAAGRPRDRADRRGRRARRRGRTSSIVLSDHGQSQGATFRQRYGEGLEDVVKRHSGGEVRAEDAHSDEGLASFNASVAEVASRDTPVGHAVRTAAGKRLEEPEADETLPEVSVMASGNLGSSRSRASPGASRSSRLAERRPGLLDALRSHPGIAFVLVRSEHLGPVVLGPAGQRLLRDDTRRGRRPARAVRRRSPPITCGAPTPIAHCPDIVVNGTFWEDLEEVAAFEELVGSHGGMGGGQAHPFVLHPPELAVAGRAGRGRGGRAPGPARLARAARAGRLRDRERARRGERLHARGGCQLRDVTRELQRRLGRGCRAGAGRSGGTCPSGSGSRSAARPARPPSPRPRGRGGPGRATVPSPRSGSARRRPRRAGRACSSSMSVSPANQTPSTTNPSVSSSSEPGPGRRRPSCQAGTTRISVSLTLTVSPTATSWIAPKPMPVEQLRRAGRDHGGGLGRSRRAAATACRGGRGAGARPARRRAPPGCSGSGTRRLRWAIRRRSTGSVSSRTSAVSSSTVACPSHVIVIPRERGGLTPAMSTLLPCRSVRCRS